MADNKSIKYSRHEKLVSISEGKVSFVYNIDHFSSANRVDNKLVIQLGTLCTTLEPANLGLWFRLLAHPFSESDGSWKLSYEVSKSGEYKITSYEDDNYIDVPDEEDSEDEAVSSDEE